MELALNMGVGAWALVFAVALVFGLLAQFIGETRTGFEWLVDGVAFALGAVVASEFIISWRAIEPVWDNLALVPALVGGLVLGIVVELATRLVTGGTYRSSGRPMSA
jgi:uncharacterized membrane protein YeaQ/YmgE (transglycosylase-associated protein family)